jgi:streptogramin lyase
MKAGITAMRPLLVLLLIQATATSATITTVVGNGESGFTGDGGEATEARIKGPFGVVKGPQGKLYFCDTMNHVVRRVDAAGKIITVAGTGQKGYGGDGGLATRAQLNEPYEVRFDAAGNMLFVEMQNHIIRYVDLKTGNIKTIAGTGQRGFSGDGGPALQAKMNRPHSIQLGPEGNLYICDIGNHRIRKVDQKTGRMSTFAGTGERKPTPDGALIKGTPLKGPRAIDFEGHQMWLALREGNAVYRLDLKKGTIHHEAGTGKKGFTGNGGPAKAATLSGPKGIAVGPRGNIYLADTESHSVRMIERQTGRLELIAGDGKKGDGPKGDPLKCRMDRLHGIFVDSKGVIYVGDTNTHRVRAIRP